MAPLVRRGWRPKNSPSVLLHRTRSHKKVSAFAALCIPPTRDGVRLTLRLHPDSNIDSLWVTRFLQHLERHLSGPIVLLWDGLNAHRSLLTRAFLADHPRIHVFPFPAYAPELNPVDYLWAYLKLNPLANLRVYGTVRTVVWEGGGRDTSVTHRALPAPPAPLNPPSYPLNTSGRTSSSKSA